MRVIELRAENFARLKAVCIRPQGGAVRITGANKEGKTTVLKAIETALRGRAGAPAEPIRRGADHADLRLDLGEVVIKRSIKRGKQGQDDWSLTVTRADGARIAKTPQAVIDAFYSTLSIDPLAFVRADPKAQVEMLKRLVKDFDFTANARKRQEAYDERTVVNRRAKEQKTMAAQTVVPPGPKPDPVDTEGLRARIEAAARHNAKVAGAIERRAGERRRAEGMLDQAERLRSQAAQLEKEAEELQQAIVDSEAAAEPPIDVGELQNEWSTAEIARMTILAHETRAHQEQLAASFEAESEKITAEIDALDAAKVEAIARANLPVPGLSLDDEGVLLNDLSFDSASGAEQMEVACAVAMALSPDLKVILVDGGERLDSKEMAVLEGMAAKAGYDLWITKVDESGACGFVIQDGEVKE